MKPFGGLIYRIQKHPLSITDYKAKNQHASEAQIWANVRSRLLHDIISTLWHRVQLQPLQPWRDSKEMYMSQRELMYLCEESGSSFNQADITSLQTWSFS